nr:MAG TPA: hypothetical protein [Caudoviricetes sp.]
MSPFQPTVHNLLKHKRLTTFSADRHIYASFCAQYISREGKIYSLIFTR